MLGKGGNFYLAGILEENGRLLMAIRGLSHGHRPAKGQVVVQFGQNFPGFSSHCHFESKRLNSSAMRSHPILDLALVPIGNFGFVLMSRNGVLVVQAHVDR